MLPSLASLTVATDAPKQKLSDNLLEAARKAQRLRQEMEHIDPNKGEEYMPKSRPYKFFDGKKCIHDDCPSNKQAQGQPPPPKPEFYERDGFTFCRRCGRDQGTYSKMVDAEERQTYRDDRERGVDRDRTERQRDGESSTGPVPPKHQQAAWRAKSTTEVSEQVKRRGERYVGAVRKLADTIWGFSNVALESATDSARQLAVALDDHKTICSVKGCNMRAVPKDEYVIAAALVKRAANVYRFRIEFKDLQEYLRRIGKNFKEGQIRNVYDRVADLLGGYEKGAYRCMVAGIQGGSGPSSLQERLLQYTSAVARVCDDAGLQYATKRAQEVVTAWFEGKDGVGSATPAVVAAAAVWSVVRRDGVDIAVVAGAIECAPRTIRDELAKHSRA